MELTEDDKVRHYRESVWINNIKENIKSACPKQIWIQKPNGINLAAVGDFIANV